MPDNDYSLLWEVSKFDWKEVEKRFHNNIPNKDVQRIGRHINLSFPIFSLIVNLNKRVEELEYNIKCLESKESVK